MANDLTQRSRHLGPDVSLVASAERGAELDPIPLPAPIHFITRRTPHGGLKIQLGLSNELPHEEDIPFDRWQGRTYSITLAQLRELSRRSTQLLDHLAGQLDLPAGAAAAGARHRLQSGGHSTNILEDSPSTEE